MRKSRVSVLHVEDDYMERIIIFRFLSQIREYEFVVSDAGSEDGAIATFSRSSPDLVILDCYLRHGTGASCVRRLHALGPHVPIICLSGARGTQKAAELIDLGASD